MQPQTDASLVPVKIVQGLDPVVVAVLADCSEAEML